MGQQWGACNPENPKNHRLRCSLLVQAGHGDALTTVVIDTGADFRTQMIAANVRHLNAVVYTHSHADHTHGIDDLRPLCQLQRHKIPVYCDAYTAQDLHTKFGYCFTTPAGSSYPPIATQHRITPYEAFTVQGAGGDITFMPLPMQHGAPNVPSEAALGFRVGTIAYIPDVNNIPAKSAAQLQNLDVLILDALRYTPHDSHFSVDEALAWIARLQPTRAILTNLNIELDYDTLAAKLPPNVVPAWDGMVV